MITLTVNAQWRITPEIGININTDQYASTKAGLHIGASVAYDIPSSSFFGLKSGLFLEQRNSSFSYFFYIVDQNPEDLTLYSADYSFNRFYMKLPVLADFHWNVGQVRMEVSVGPYVAVGVGGNTKYILYYHDADYNLSLTEKGKNDFFADQRRFDWGMTAAFSVEYKRFVCTLSEDLGYGKQFKGQYRDGIRPYYHTFSLSVGYRF